jgi:hypothetical protein
VLKCSRWKGQDLINHKKKAINPLKTEFLLVFKYSVCTSGNVTATKTTWLMPVREIVTHICENHIKHLNAFCGQNRESYYVKAGGSYSNHWALRAKLKSLSLFFICASSLSFRTDL